MRTFAALSALSVALAAPAPASDMVVPIARDNLVTREDGRANVAAIFHSFNKTLAKYKAPLLPYNAAIAQEQANQGLIGSVGLKKRQKAKEPLSDQVEDGEDEDYYGSSIIGSGDKKPQTFTLDFDTGSADIFIPGPQCGSAQGCPHNTKYDQGGVDQKRTTTVTYGSGQISGEDYSDDVSVAGLKVTNQTLISLTQSTGFDDLTPDGLMGMGFSTIAETGSPTYFENLIKQKKVTTQEFAFYLGRAASKTTSASELALGGRNTAKYSGTVVQVPVTTPGYWQVALDSVKVNGASAGATTKGQAAIDTGTTVVLAPSAAAAAIFANIPGSLPVPQGEFTFYAYPCNTSTKYIPSITFAGKNFAINPLDFNFGSVSASDLGLTGVLGGLLGGDDTSSYCLAGIAGGDINPTENLYVVGDVFLKNWYSIFNYVNAGGKPSVSFAKAK